MKSVTGGALLVILGAAAAFFVSQKQPIDAPALEPQKPNIQQLRMAGSNTVGEDFAPLLAKEFLKSKRTIFIQQQQLSSPVEKTFFGELPSGDRMLQVEIKAHGSSTGFTALENGEADIAMSSRPIKAAERTRLQQRVGALEEYPIALDALAIVTYPENPVDTLTIEQIAAIFSGEITSWQQLGGEDVAISLFSRDHKSGTWDTFNNLVLKSHKAELSAQAFRFESSSLLVSRVVETSGGIGFVGVAYTGNGKIIKIAKTAEQPGVLPNGYTIGTQAYPLSRNLYLYRPKQNNSMMVRDFIDFATRNDGQKLANQAGLVSYYPTHYRPQLLQKKTPQVYRGLSTLGLRLTVDFSANPKQLDTAKEARDLERLHNFARFNPARSFILVDFSGSKRLQAIEEKLRQKQIKVLDTLSLEDSSFQRDSIEVWVL